MESSADFVAETTAHTLGAETSSSANDDAALTLTPSALLDPFDLDSEVAPPLCPRCLVDLSRLSTLARFCPRCGEQLLDAPNPLDSAMVRVPFAQLAAPPRPLAPLPPLEKSPEKLAAEVQRLAEEWLRLAQATTAAGSPGAAANAHSLMLQAYSNAMYRLGWRYERGTGASRNVDEAMRCYFKAARLGNSEALQRLTPRCAGEAVSPTPPEET